MATTFNIVRFRVKPGKQEEFIEAHRRVESLMPGGRRFVLIKTGEQTFAVVGEWDNQQSLVDARPQMIGMLDSFRHTLEDLGNGLGVTDPVSGEVVLELKPR